MSIRDSYRWSVTIGALLPFLVLGILLLVYNKGPGMSERHTSLLLANAETEIRLSQSQLWFEEFLEADSSVTLEEVWASLDRAETLNRSLLTIGQQSGSAASVFAPENLLTLVRRSEILIQEIRVVGEKRLANPLTSLAGSPLEQDFDAIYGKLHDNEKLIAAAILSSVRENSAQLRFLIISLSAGVIFVSVAASVAIQRFERQRLNVALKLEQGEKRYRALFNNMGTCVAIYSAVDDGENFVFRDINRAAEKSEGIALADLVGRRVTEVLPSISDFGLLEVFQRVWQTGQAEHLPVSLYENGRIAGWRENYVYKLPTGEIVAVYDDVTEKKIAEEQAMLATEKAEIASQAKSEFLTSMSHELRTPMNAILGFAQILKSNSKHPLSKEQDQQIDYIMEGGNHLLELINQVLDLSKIESDQSDLLVESVNINSMVQECVTLAAPLCEPENISVTDNFSSGRPVFVLADHLRLKQIIINLLSNAIKYNKPGGSVTITGNTVNDKYMQIELSDTGVGIAEEDRESVYQMFHRIGVTSGKPSEGSGIGLSVTKLLVEKMGGRISFESQKGIGTTFRVELPLAEEPAAAGGQQESD